MTVFDHVGLSVADLDRQNSFYGQALGLTEVEESFEMPGIRTVILTRPDGLKIELIERENSAPQQFADPFEAAGTQGYFHWCLAVDDVEQAFAQLIEAGAKEVSPPADGIKAGTRFAYVKDPEGNLLELKRP
jgi:catechol 2,3-dioxygenase-like lactoylglutathione lyase family enzyme